MQFPSRIKLVPSVFSLLAVIALSGVIHSLPAQTLQEQVQQALESRKDDPCYIAIFQQEVARRMTGKELPWVQYSPVELHFEWEIEEKLSRRGGFPADVVRYRLRESAAGCQTITYDQQTNSKVQRLVIQGPHHFENASGKLQPAGPFRRNFTRVEGHFLACKIAGSDCRSYQTTKADHFRFKEESYPEFELLYSSGYGLEERYVAAAADCFDPVRDRIVINSSRQFRSTLPDCVDGVRALNKSGDLAFRLSDWKQAIENGSWELSYPLSYSWNVGYESYQRTGRLNLKIVFRPGKLEVSPADKWIINGPDQDKKFLGETRNYTLKNQGGSAIRYRVRAEVPWVTIDKTEGEILPGKEAIINAKLNEAGKLLKDGVYKGWISFTNLTNGVGDSKREVQLEVEPEQRWRMTLTGFEQDGGEAKIYVYEKVFLGTSFKPYITYKGVRFDHKVKVEFVIKKIKGKWYYQSGVVTYAEVKVSNNYDPVLFHVFSVRCLNCGRVSGLSGRTITGSLSDNSVLIEFPSTLQTKADVIYKLKTGCRNVENPNSECNVQNKKLTREAEAAQFFPNAGSYYVPLIDKDVSDDMRVARGDKMPWMRLRFFMERLK